MIKVLICAPSTKEKIINTRWVTAPLGAHYIASYLNNNGHYAKVWDINIDSINFEQTILSNKWDIVAFSTLEATLEYDLSKIHLAKKLTPKSLLIAGGTGASLNYQEFFNKSPLHIVIMGEGEFPLLQLCNMLEHFGYNNAPLHTIPGIVIKQPANILLPEEYWQIRKCLDIKAMQQDKYWAETAKLYDTPDYTEINTFRLYTSNYCPMNCAFCTLTKLRHYSCNTNKVPVITLYPDQIIELINNVLEVYKDCYQIFFVDDDFFIDKKRSLNFCKKVIDLKYQKKLPDYLKFICLTNINRIDKSNIQYIANAGFRVLSIGVESVSQHVLDSLDKKQTVQTIWDTTELILKNGVKPYYTLLMWTPFCTIEDIIIDLHGFRKLAFMGVGLSIEPYLIPLRGTRLAEEGIDERKRKINIEGTNLFIYKGFAWPPMNKNIQPVFARFEQFYAKYRKLMLDNNKGIHLEKNWQAKIVLDSVEIVLHEFGYLNKSTIQDLTNILQKVNSMPDCNVDIVGNITEE